MNVAHWHASASSDCHTRRGEIKPGCRFDYKDVDPAWLKRNAEDVEYQWRYWDGVTSSYPGKWVSGCESTLRAAKKKAAEAVSSGAARHHGCEVSLVCWTWGNTLSSYGLRAAWTYGVYELEAK